MKLFFVALLLAEVVVLYFLDHSQYRKLIKWKNFTLGHKYKTLSVTTDSYTPLHSQESSHSKPLNYTLPLSLSPHMDYEDAYELYNMKRVQSCVPGNFGYTSQQAEQTFPLRNYPRCTERYRGFGVPEIKVNLISNTLTIDCKNTTHIEYFVGPVGKLNFTAGPDSVAEMEIESYKGPFKISQDTEFVMAKCGKDSDFEISAVWHRRDEELYQKYVKRRDHKVKPFLMAYIALDSFSRRHMYQKLPETMKLLNSLNANSAFEVHDFKLHNVIGDGSVPNILPVMSNQYNPKPAVKLTQQQKESFLWDSLAEKGFITLIAQEACDYRFTDHFGNTTSFHHIFRQFYCGAQNLGTYSFEKFSTEKQRCIGANMSHVYALEYINQYVEHYPEAHKWFYAHFEAGHEATGLHAETLDLDFRDFLQRLLTNTRDSHNVALIINADHGMRFGEWQKDSAAFQEHKLPPLFTVTSKELLDMIPNSRNTLLTNSWRLSSKKDIRRTMQYLSNYPNFTQFPQEDPVHNYNLYTEEIDINRTCKDARIPIWHCSCINFQDIDLSYAHSSNKELYYLLSYITDYAIYIINKEAYSTYSLYPGSACQKVELLHIDRAFGFSYDNMSELIKIQFSVRNQKNASFTALFLISPRPYDSLDKTQNDYYYGRLESYLYRGYLSYFKMINLSRMDPFEGTCAEFARRMEVKPDFCFCKEGFEGEMK
jgi:hypothetical protein